MSLAIGQIYLFAGNSAPKNWLFCEGQALLVKSYEPLFSIIGHTYGGGGSSFNLPDLRGRVPIHKNNNPDPNKKFSTIELGKSAGKESITLNVSNLPPHVHIMQPRLRYNTSIADETSPSGGSLAHGEAAMYVLDEVGYDSAFNKNAISVITENTGSGAPINIRQPSLGMNYIIMISTQTTD